MSKWRIRFRYIAPYDYNTPLMYIPIEETVVLGETAEIAWKGFIESFSVGQDNIKRESIEEEGK
jgi:hypothetical protein